VAGAARRAAGGFSLVGFVGRPLAAVAGSPLKSRGGKLYFFVNYTIMRPTGATVVPPTSIKSNAIFFFFSERFSFA